MTIQNKKSTNYKKKLSIITILLLSSCSSMPDALFPNGRPASHYEKMTIEKLSSKVKVEYNASKQQKEYRAPKIETWKSRYLLRGWKGNDEKTVTNQLYVTLFYSSRRWRNYNTARDIGNFKNNKVKLTSLEKEVSSCSIQLTVNAYNCNYRETVGVILPTNYLQRHKDSGMKVEISNKNNETKLIIISNRYIQAYLNKLN